MLKETYTLNNGVAIPKLGLGTWFIDDDKVADAVREAVKIGYRHIDTAQAYGNERGVGEGVRTCGIPREELFVVSKVAAEHKTYEEAKAGIDGTLEKMGLDYLDMMIIHSPQPWVKVNQSDDRYVEGNRAAWRALEEAYKEGKLKAIGISNFQIGDIESLMETAEIKPMVNQILLHISNIHLIDLGEGTFTTTLVIFRLCHLTKLLFNFGKAEPLKRLCCDVRVKVIFHFLNI